jgi:hypothetical protein
LTAPPPDQLRVISCTGRIYKRPWRLLAYADSRLTVRLPRASSTKQRCRSSRAVEAEIDEDSLADLPRERRRSLTQRAGDTKRLPAQEVNALRGIVNGAVLRFCS